jgi:hypothetical protein
MHCMGSMTLHCTQPMGVSAQPFPLVIHSILSCAVLCCAVLSRT